MANELNHISRNAGLQNHSWTRWSVARRVGPPFAVLGGIALFTVLPIFAGSTGGILDGLIVLTVIAVCVSMGAVQAIGWPKRTSSRIAAFALAMAVGYLVEFALGAACVFLVERFERERQTGDYTMIYAALGLIAVTMAVTALAKGALAVAAGIKRWLVGVIADAMRESRKP